jgi:hypothetical protein
VTPEAADYLSKARESLTKARDLLNVLHYSDEAGRAAYLAGFHAAQAFIFERIGNDSGRAWRPAPQCFTIPARAAPSLGAFSREEFGCPPTPIM